MTTLAQAAAGRALPTLPVTVAYVRACGGDVPEWERRWHTLAAELANSADLDPPTSAGPDPAAPYIGLAPYELGDAALFFGRDELIDELVQLVDRTRFVALFGASGVGKSSLLRAGLAARTRHERVELCTPGAHPVTEFERLLARSEGDVLVVVDQFEELFTVCDDRAEREQFIAALLAAATDTERRVHVVIGVRTDFYAHCLEDPDLAELICRGQFLVRPMTGDELRSVITQPARSVGATVETALLTTLVAECAGQPGVLPLLSHALRETWRRRRGMTLTLTAYHAAGGIAHALARTAEHTYGQCDPHQQHMMKALLLRLIAVGEGTEDTKRRIDRGEIDDPETLNVVDHLTHVRLISADGDSIQLAHEALIRHWPRLREWLDEDREGRLIHQQLTIAAREWDALDRHPDVLYRGIRLDIARAWADGDVVLTRREEDFLLASRQAAVRSRIAARRRLVLVALLTVLVLAAGAAIMLVRNQQHMIATQHDSAEAGKLIELARGLEKTDPDTAEQLAVDAAELTSDPNTSKDALTVLTTAMNPTRPPATDTARLGDHGQVLEVAIRPGFGQFWYLTGPVPTLLGVVPIPTAPPPSVPELVAPGTDLVDLNDHLLLVPATAADSAANPVATLWDITDPSRPTVLDQFPDPYFSAHFDGTLYVVTDQQVWDVTNPRRPVPFRSDTNDALVAGSVHVSPDGNALAAIADQHVVLWDLTAPYAALPAATISLPGWDPRQLAWANPDTLIVSAAYTAPTYWNVKNPYEPTLIPSGPHFCAVSPGFTGAGHCSPNGD